MTRADNARDARAVAARTAAAGAVAATVLTAAGAIFSGTSFAAGGPQGEPALVPASVQAPTDAFSLVPPPDARCAEDGGGTRGDTSPGPRTGADDWRWHGFIVEEGRDLSTLRFGPFGPGDDFDATDGTITAALMTAGGEGVWQRIPGLEPAGHVNPDELAGLVLDPDVYTLRAGRYQIGFACTDAALATRQWWATTVTISTSASPFMDAAPATGEQSGAAGSRTAAGAQGAVADGAGPTDTAAATLESVAPAGTATGGDEDPGRGSGAPTRPPAREVRRSATDVSWSPLVALRVAPFVLPVGWWALLAAVLARTAYLLARPLRTRPLPAP